MKGKISLVAALFLTGAAAFAAVFGSVRGIVHDAQHRPVENAMVMLRANTSDWGASAYTDANGQFVFNAVGIGEYTVTIAAPGFNQMEQKVQIAAGTQPVLHFLLSVASSRETVDVSATPEAVATDTATPGADRSNSMAMITDFVPGAYLTHDQVHMRGGHQMSWMVDGVPVPNTNIASNLGPQFDPKDIDYLEVDRGSYGAEMGDRTYGVFNVAPRTGFERNRQAEVVVSAGNFYQTNDAFSLGDHTQNFAYYIGLNANRSNLGIEAPVPRVVHDAENGFGGFSSLIFNVDPANQLRLVLSLRRDFYQIPYDPDPGDIENAPIAANGFQAQYPSLDLRDADRESDALANFSWVHTFNSKLRSEERR